MHYEGGRFGLGLRRAAVAGFVLAMLAAAAPVRAVPDGAPARIVVGITAQHEPLGSAKDGRLGGFAGGDGALETVRDRRLGEGAGVAVVPLSPAEREALLAHKRIRYTVPRLLPPFAMQAAQGQLEGLTVDFLAHLGRVLKVDFVYVPTAGPDAACAALRGGRVDLVAGAMPCGHTPDQFLEAGVYSRVPLVIVTRMDTAYVKGPDGLRGQRVAISRQSPMLEPLRGLFPLARLIEVENAAEGLALVNANRADAAIGNLSTMDTMVRERYPTSLKVTGSTGLDLDFGLLAAPSLAPLHEVLARALASMPELDRLRIERRWASAIYQFGTPWQEILQRAWPVIMLLAGIGIAGTISYARMRRLVALRLKTEARLAHELAFNEALLACLPEPVAAKGADWRYMQVNPAFERFFGVRKDELVGKTMAEVDVLEGRVPAEISALQEAALATTEPKHGKFLMENADGQQRRVVFWAVPIRNGDGAPGGIVCVHFDVTDIDEAREQAEVLERRLSAVVESLPVTVFQARIPAEGLAVWEVAYAAGDCTGLGFDPANCLGMRSEENTCFCREDLPRMRAAFLESARQNRPFELEARLRAGGAVHWVQVRAVPQVVGGVTLWNGVMFDMTDRRRQADALRDAKEAAEAALRAKESFLAMMSHEIRTPMNGVLGLVELLQRTPLDAGQSAMLALARQSGEALGRVLDDILDYAKIEAGRLTIAPAPLDLREVFDSVLALLQAQAQEKGLQLRLSVSADVPATVQADGIRVRQILFNLFGNAIKFTDRGSVTLRATVEAGEGDTATVLVEVEDTGIGIPRDDVQRLFAPFVQSERSSTRRFGGTGLGLAISRRLASMMGGRLTLESEEGVGTTAALRVPCRVLCQAYDLPLLKGRSVAICVSDPRVADALRAHVRTAGMVAVEASDGTAPAEIVFADRMHASPASARACVIRVTTKWKQFGFQSDQAGVRLSANPLRWDAFIGAVEGALERQDPMPGALATAGRRRAMAPVVPDDSGVHPDGARRRILVAEDHRINQEVLRQQLKLLGYVPTIVENGSAALAALSGEAFDLVLTDCHMPAMDGFELTRHIRTHEQEAIRELPVVGITATTVLEEHQRCFEVGMDACVLKPTTLASLQSGLASAMDAHHVGEARSFPSEDLAGRVPVGTVPSPDTPVGALCFDASKVDRLAVLGALQLGDSVAMRRACRESVAPDRDALVALLEQGDVGGLRSWCHRVGGALSMFRQSHVDGLLDAFHEIVKSGVMADIRSAGSAVLDMVDYLLRVLGEPGEAGEAECGETGHLAEASPPASCRDCTRSPEECGHAQEQRTSFQNNTGTRQ